MNSATKVVRVITLSGNARDRRTRRRAMAADLRLEFPDGTLRRVSAGQFQVRVPAAEQRDTKRRKGKKR